MYIPMIDFQVSWLNGICMKVLHVGSSQEKLLQINKQLSLPVRNVKW